MVDHAFKSKVMSGFRWATISRLLMQLISWTVTFVVVRLLVPDDYGKVAMATLLSTYLALLGEMGFSTALIQRQRTTERESRAIFGALLIVGLVLGCATVAASPFVAGYFREQSVVSLSLLAALQFIVMPFTVLPQARLSIDLRFRDLGLAGVASTAVGSALTLLLAYAGFGPYALLWGSLISAFARAAILNLLAPSLMKPIFAWREVRGFAGFSGFVIGGRTIWYWYEQADVLIVGSLMGATSLGVFSIAKQLAAIPLDRFGEIMNMIALPAFAAAKDRRDVVVNGYTKAVRLGATMAFPVFVGLALVAPGLVPIILGPKWDAAIPVLQILCLVMPLRVIGSIGSPVVTAIGRPDVSFRCVVVTAVCVSVALLVGARWGLEGVAVGWVVGFPVAFLLATWLIANALQEPMLRIVRPILEPAIASLVMATAVIAVTRLVPTGTNAKVVVALQATVGVVTYPAALFILSRQVFSEARGFIISFLSSRKEA